MAEHVIEINDESFKSEVLESDKPVLVDFWAPWCGPCRAIGPIVDELADPANPNSFAGKLKFTKCNVDENPSTPTKYGIKAIPTLIFFKDGQVLEQITGIVAKSKLQNTINGILEGKTE